MTLIPCSLRLSLLLDALMGVLMDVYHTDDDIGALGDLNNRLWHRAH